LEKTVPRINTNIQELEKDKNKLPKLEDRNTNGPKTNRLQDIYANYNS
jgi:hypothetical protein